MKHIYCLTLVIWNFLHNAMYIYSTFWSHHYVGHAQKPYGRRQNHESASILSKIISTNFSENTLFEEHMYQIVSFYHKLAYYSFGY